MEVLVTVLVLSVGLMGLASLQSKAMHATNAAGQRAQAAWIAESLANRMRTNPEGASDYTGSMTPADCTDAPANQCGPAAGNGASDCTPTQMANFDLWESVCSYLGDASAYEAASMTDDLGVSQIVITGGPDEYDVTVTVASKAGGPTGDTVTQQSVQTVRP